MAVSCEQRVPPPKPFNLEAVLAEAVREYIADPADELLWPLCSALEYLVEHLVDLDGWCDGVEPAWGLTPTNAVEIVSAGELRLRARALWYDGTGHSWVDPLFCHLRIAATGNQIESYQLKFGDRERGVGTWPYGKHIRRIDWLEPKAWAYEFTANPDRPTP